jgi:hypothetical protein
MAMPVQLDYLAEKPYLKRVAISRNYTGVTVIRFPSRANNSAEIAGNWPYASHRKHQRMRTAAASGLGVNAAVMGPGRAPAALLGPPGTHRRPDERREGSTQWA